MSVIRLTIAFIGHILLPLRAAAFLVFFSILPVSIFSSDSAFLPAQIADWSARFVHCLRNTLSTVVQLSMCKKEAKKAIKKCKVGRKESPLVQILGLRLTPEDKASSVDWQERLQFGVKVRINQSSFILSILLALLSSTCMSCRCFADKILRANWRLPTWTHCSIC